jgi:hypothetical protein
MIFSNHIDEEENEILFLFIFFEVFLTVSLDLFVFHVLLGWMMISPINYFDNE